MLMLIKLLEKEYTETWDLNTSHVNVNPMQISHLINLLSLSSLINSSFIKSLPSK